MTAATGNFHFTKKITLPRTLFRAFLQFPKNWETRSEKDGRFKKKIPN